MEQHALMDWCIYINFKLVYLGSHGSHNNDTNDTHHNDTQHNNKYSATLSIMVVLLYCVNRTAHKKCKQLFAYQHLLLLRNIWWSKF
jgi:hypothetical protein